MEALPEYSQVEIVELLHAPEHYDGWKMNKRPPAIGDRGVVVERLSEEDYVVECSGPDGIGIWLGDFKRCELRLVAIASTKREDDEAAGRRAAGSG
jgi:hypothetical protein